MSEAEAEKAEKWYHPQSWDAVLSTLNVAAMHVYVLIGVLLPDGRETFQQTVAIVLPALAGMQTIVSTRHRWRAGKEDRKEEANGKADK